jgi:hypothetical protein
LRFYFVGRKDEPWEEEAAAWFASHPGEKPELYDQQGSIFVTANGQEAQVADQLLSLIPALCFDAVATVLDRGVAEFDLYTAATGVRLAAVGEELEMVSNVFTPVRFAKWPVLEGLVACGERFVRLADQVWAGDPYHDVLAQIAEAGAGARAILNAARKPG